MDLATKPLLTPRQIIDIDLLGARSLNPALASVLHAAAELARGDAIGARRHILSLLLLSGSLPSRPLDDEVSIGAVAIMRSAVEGVEGHSVQMCALRSLLQVVERIAAAGEPLRIAEIAGSLCVWLGRIEAAGVVPLAKAA